VQAICDFVHNHIKFGYEHTRPIKTAWEAYHERTGVCRDFAHLAVTFCRCMNIPARYCTGYLSDIGVPPPYGPMDFAGWFEAYLAPVRHHSMAYRSPRTGSGFHTLWKILASRQVGFRPEAQANTGDDWPELYR
jgi:transglutaminase-like putative cysteine protease